MTDTTPERRALLERARSGDKAALNEALIEYQYLVRWVASRFPLPSYIGREDLEQDGLIALVDAIAEWDPSRPFEPLARLVAWRAMFRSINRHNRSAANVLSFDYGWDDDGQGITEQGATEIIRHLTDGTDAVGEVDQRLSTEQDFARVRLAMSTLTDDEQGLIRDAFGLDGQPWKTRVEIARLMGVGLDTVTNRKYRALKTIRNAVEKAA
jgi:RNA polymerase sigma factor (sigma-70 family)